MLSAVLKADLRARRQTCFDWTFIPKECAVSRGFSPTRTLNVPISRRFRISLRWAPAVLLSTVIWLILSAAASASCGNYLFRNGKPVGEHAMGSSPDDLAALRASGSRSMPYGLPAGGCNGPHCSGHQLPWSPASVPTSIVKFRDQPAFVAGVPDGNSLRTVSGQVPTSESGEFFEPPLIFRPPAA